MKKRLFVVLMFFYTAGVFAQKANQKSAYEQFNHHFLAGVREWILQNPEAAVTHFEQCLQLTDTVAAVHYYLAAAYNRLNEPDLAQQSVEQALRLDPGNKWYKELEKKISRASATQETRPAQSQKKMLTEKEVLQSLNDARRRLQGDAWYAFVKETAEKYPYYPQVQWQAAHAAYELGKWDDAEMFLLNGMDFALENKDLLKKYYTLLRDVYRRQGNTREAQRYEKLLKELSE